MHVILIFTYSTFFGEPFWNVQMIHTYIHTHTHTHIYIHELYALITVYFLFHYIHYEIEFKTF